MNLTTGKGDDSTCKVLSGGPGGVPHTHHIDSRSHSLSALILPGWPIALALLAQIAQANAWDGTWKWASYAERIAYGERFIAEAREIARESCGRPYFGTYC